MTRSDRNRRAERLDPLTQTARDTEMGQLLRRFWHPVAVSRTLGAGTAKALRILGEELTIYRGASGRAHLVGGRCAHRLTRLATGSIEGEHIRCMYHGWLYDGAGQCVERPAERQTRPGEIAIAAYPVEEYCGLVFAYLGAGTPPPFDLPRKAVFERPGAIIYAKEEPWPCNWFQMVENSMDAAHVSFVHQKGRLGTFGAAVTPAVPQLSYAETEAGIRQTATRSPTNVRVSDWTFPNNNHISQPGLTRDDPWIDVAIWMVPQDDESTSRFTLWSVPRTGGAADQRFLDYCARHGDYNPADHHDALMEHGQYPDDLLMELTSAQDYVVQVGQGRIADRAKEWLGESDAGIVFLRRIFLRELEAIRTGRPAKEWRRLAQPAELPVQVA